MSHTSFVVELVKLAKDGESFPYKDRYRREDMFSRRA